MNKRQAMKAQLAFAGIALSANGIVVQNQTQKPIDLLRETLADGTFHHATYRNIGTLWEGLWFYVKDPTGFRGFSVAGCVYKNDPEIDAAYALVRGTGVSVGSYGRG